VEVSIVEDRPGTRWLRVKTANIDGAWRKGSKVVLKTSVLYVRRTGVIR
jgi:hypothetical protein